MGVTTEKKDDGIHSVGAQQHAANLDGFAAQAGDHGGNVAEATYAVGSALVLALDRLATEIASVGQSVDELTDLVETMRKAVDK